MTDLDRLRKRLYAVVDTMVDALEEAEHELRVREESVEEREAIVDDFLHELELWHEDFVATDTTERYVKPETYEVDGREFLRVGDLPERECHVLAHLQKMAEPDALGNVFVSKSNKELSRIVSTDFDPVSPSAISACLTRLQHKGIITVQSLSGRGYPRKILLEALLERPDAFLQYQMFR